MGQGFVAVVMELSGNCLWWMLHPQHWSDFLENLQAVAGHNIIELTLSIAPSSVCCITDFPGLPVVHKKMCDSLKQIPTSILHTMRQPWGFTNLCFLLCYWNKSEFRQYCYKDEVLGEKKSTGSVNFSVPLPLGTKEWSTWLARTGGIYLTWSLCKRTSPTSSPTGGSMCPRIPAGASGSCPSGLPQSRALLSIV